MKLRVYPNITEIPKKEKEREKDKEKEALPNKMLYFTTADKLVMRIEATCNRFRIFDSLGIIKEEVPFSEMSIIKLDEQCRCVTIVKKTCTSSTIIGSPTRSKSNMIQLYKENANEAIELHKYLKNAYLLRSEKKSANNSIMA